MDQVSTNGECGVGKPLQGNVLGIREMPLNGDTPRSRGNELREANEVQSACQAAPLPRAEQTADEEHQKLERCPRVRLERARSIAPFESVGMATPKIPRAGLCREIEAATTGSTPDPGAPRKGRTLRASDSWKYAHCAGTIGRAIGDKGGKEAPTSPSSDPGKAVSSARRVVLWGDGDRQVKVRDLDGEDKTYLNVVPSGDKGEHAFLEWFHRPGNGGSGRSPVGGSTLSSLSAASRWFASKLGGEGESRKHECSDSSSNESSTPVGLLAGDGGRKGKRAGRYATDEADCRSDSDAPKGDGGPFFRLYERALAHAEELGYGTDMEHRIGREPTSSDEERIRRIRRDAPKRRERKRKPRGAGKFFDDEAILSGPDDSGESSGTDSSDDSSLSGFIERDERKPLVKESKTAKQRGRRLVAQDEEDDEEEEQAGGEMEL